MQNDMWTQFMNFQGPAMNQMMSAYMDQSKKMVQQMQEQLQSQTRNMMFTGVQFPTYPPDGKKPEGADK
jgi:polyhydroxyalkanoate synthesis regulator protein